MSTGSEKEKKNISHVNLCNIFFVISGNIELYLPYNLHSFILRYMYSVLSKNVHVKHPFHWKCSVVTCSRNFVLVITIEDRKQNLNHLYKERCHYSTSKSADNDVQGHKL